MTKPRKRNSPSDSPEARRERRKRHYDRSVELTRVYCSICGEKPGLRGLARQFGFHRKCDPARYQRELRKTKSIKHDHFVDASK